MIQAIFLLTHVRDLAFQFCIIKMTDDTSDIPAHARARSAVFENVSFIDVLVNLVEEQDVEDFEESGFAEKIHAKIRELQQDRVAQRRVQWSNMNESFEMVLEKYFEEVSTKDLQDYLKSGDFKHQRNLAKPSNIVQGVGDNSHRVQSMMHMTSNANDGDILSNFVAELEISEDGHALAYKVLEKNQEDLHPNFLNNVEKQDRRKKLNATLATRE